MATETAVDVVMPQMGVSVSEGTITKWLKREGEQVEADEPLLEISTDKVDTEVPSPASGTVTQILVQEGQTVDVGTKLGQIGGSAAGAGGSAGTRCCSASSAGPARRRTRGERRTATRRCAGAAARRGAGVDERDAARNRRAYAPLAGHVRTRHERDRG